jgi:O-acetylserine/cysteine efflux transporter
MGLAFTGVIVIAGEPRLSDSLDSVALVITGAVFWAIAQIMISRLKSLSGITILTWVAIIATPQMLLISLVIEDGQWESLKSASLLDWSIVFYLSMIMTVIGYSVWYHLLRICDVSRLSPFLMLLPVTSIIAGIVLLEEQFTIATPVITNIPPIPIAIVNCSSRSTIPAMIEVTGKSIKKGDNLLTSQIRNK